MVGCLILDHKFTVMIVEVLLNKTQSSVNIYIYSTLFYAFFRL